MKKLILIATVAALAATADAAALRRLDVLTATEGASVEFPAPQAVALKSSNTSIATVMPPDGGRSMLTAVRLGNAEITFSNVKGPYAVMPVRIVPTYWDTLVRFFEDDPEITLSVGGDKVIISGQTANPDTIDRVEKATKFDAARILPQVSYSTTAVGLLVKAYIAQIGYSNVTVSAVGRNICLKGRLYDQKTIDLVKTRATEFLKPFAGIGLNTDGLKVIKQRIILTAEFLEYNIAQARNLGIKWPTAVTVGGTFEYGWDWSREDGADNTETRTGNNGLNNTLTRALTDTATTTSGKTTSTSSDTLTSTSERTAESTLESVLEDTLEKSNKQTMKTEAFVGGDADGGALTATINLLKHNEAAKTLYKTTLATQSGEEVEFQNGGTRTVRLEGTFSGGETKDIEWGFLVKALPIIVDATSVNLSLSLDNKTEPTTGSTTGDINLRRYQTKSKYIVRPGETIVMSGFNGATEDSGKDGVPFLSKIPGIGPWLFGNRSTSDSQTEMLLIVTVNWALETESETSVKARDELKAKSADVEMP